MIERINKTLKKRLNKFNLAKSAQAAFICCIADRVGKIYNFKSISFDKNVLRIGVDHSVMAQEIQLREKEILRTINEKLKNDLVKRLRYQISK